jgi:hypothetical protein
MTIRNSRAAAAALVFSFAAAAGLAPNAAHAEVPSAARVEIDHLVAYVAGSGCEFYRNGSWYDSKKGAEHLQMKLDYLSARNMIQAAGDFIDKAATQSSMSSLAYQVRCAGGEPVTSAKWLNDELARFRGLSARGSGETKATTVAATPSAATAVVARPVAKVN